MIHKLLYALYASKIIIIIRRMMMMMMMMMMRRRIIVGIIIISYLIINILNKLNISSSSIGHNTLQVMQVV